MASGTVRTSSRIPVQKLIGQGDPICRREMTRELAVENSSNMLIEPAFSDAEFDKDFLGRRPAVRKPTTRNLEDP